MPRWEAGPCQRLARMSVAKRGYEILQEGICGLNCNSTPIKCQSSASPYLRRREADLFLCSSHRFGLIAPSDGCKRANGKAKSTGAERSAVPGDGRQPQANKHNKGAFIPGVAPPQTKGNEVNTLRIRPVDAGMAKLFLYLTCPRLF